MVNPSQSNIPGRITAPVDMLKPAIAELLRRIPETWQAYRPDDLTETQSQALFLLTAAGLVERRERFRLRMMNHPVIVEATITATGEYGGVEAMHPLAASTWAEWQDAYRQWKKSDTADVPPMHCERLEPSEWRLTDQGTTARKDLTDGEEARVRDFVLKCGFFQNRPPVRGVGALVKMDKTKAEPAAPGTVNIGNWGEGGEALAQAITKAFAMMDARREQSAAKMGEASASGTKKKGPVGVGMELHTADALIRKYLEEHAKDHTVTVRELVKEIHCSRGLVAKCPAWQTYMKVRKEGRAPRKVVSLDGKPPSKQFPRGSGLIHITPATQQYNATAEPDLADEIDKKEELERLIREQENDRKADVARHFTPRRKL